MKYSNGFRSFSSLFLSLGSRKRAPREKQDKGCPRKLSTYELITAIVFHVMSGAGTLGEHLQLLSGLRLSESSLSERRISLPWKIFESLLGDFLSVRCREKEQPKAFYRGLRLVALDGTQFSLTNTPQILANCTKAVSRRVKAAFAKLGSVVLLEIGAHNPIAVVVASSKQESEWELALRVVDQMPAKSLLLADRLYGVASFLNGFAVADGILTDKQKEDIKSQFYTMLAQHCTKETRTRSYPGKVRQPVKGWPRLLENSHETGQVTYQIISEAA